MKKIQYIFVILGLVGALVASPAHAQSPEQIQKMIASIMAQVQELQRQLKLLQEKEGSISRPAIQITVTYPRGQEKFTVGDTMTITWEGYVHGVDKLSAHLIAYKGGRTEVMEISDGSTIDADVRAYSWIIPESIIPYGGSGFGYAIELRGKAWSTESEKFFIYADKRGPRIDENRQAEKRNEEGRSVGIGERPLRVTAPNGGERFVERTTTTITWDDPIEMSIPERYDIYARSMNDGEERYEIKSGFVTNMSGNGQSYTWKVGERSNGTPLREGMYKIEVCPEDTDPEASNVCDASDRSFEIVKNSLQSQATKQTVKVLSPNSSEDVWYVGGSYTIAWDAKKYPSNTAVQIALRDNRSSSGIAAGEEVIVNTTNTGSYTFTVPKSLGHLSGGWLDGKKVYSVVVYVDGGGMGKSDESDTPFSILVPTR